MVFFVVFYPTFKEEIIPALHRPFHKIEIEVTLPNLFYEASINLMLKPNKHFRR